MYWGAIILGAATVALSGCWQAPDPKAEHLARENDSTIVNPPGRYQAIANPRGAGVYVLDTRTGAIRLCAATARENDGGDYAKFAVGCTPPAQ